ncbi:MAG: SdpI family protein [Finegoldia sp.]|nr:SdpI family protein [Finegoldia sp.]
MYKFKAKSKKISKISGFRSSLSTKSKENWEFAHRYASKLLFIYGVFFLLINIILLYLNFINTVVMTIMVILEILAYCLIGYRVDFVLKNRDPKF